ncbi:hypothetical protein JTE90_005115 [Oedothorax gibbosus]|uniref:Uncharacterized protein n=1 Tax=Oedothorax gibbosus TaxID=931172 RepID=A0AAV6ULL8_9ARAC|nr:hypothetical protein JTE90_005115 [Oedothorax gibbosus]
MGEWWHKERYCKHLRKAGREGWAGGIQCSKKKVVSPGHEKVEKEKHQKGNRGLVGQKVPRPGITKS